MNNSCFFSPIIIIWTILKEVFTMSVPESVRKVARPVNTILKIVEEIQNIAML